MLIEKVRKLRLRHLARRHGEITVLDLAPTLNRFDADVVRGIGEYDRRTVAAHEPSKMRSFPRVAAKEAVRSEQPHITDTANRLCCKRRRLVGRVDLGIDKVAHQAVDLGGLKAC